MFPEECEIGLAVDHISGCQGIIISAPQYIVIGMKNGLY